MLGLRSLRLPQSLKALNLARRSVATTATSSYLPLRSLWGSGDRPLERTTQSDEHPVPRMNQNCPGLIQLEATSCAGKLARASSNCGRPICCESTCVRINAGRCGIYLADNLVSCRPLVEDETVQQQRQLTSANRTVGTETGGERIRYTTGSRTGFPR